MCIPADFIIVTFHNTSSIDWTLTPGHWLLLSSDNNKYFYEILKTQNNITIDNSKHFREIIVVAIGQIGVNKGRCHLYI